MAYNRQTKTVRKLKLKCCDVLPKTFAKYCCSSNRSLLSLSEGSRCRLYSMNQRLIRFFFWYLMQIGNVFDIITSKIGRR